MRIPVFAAFDHARSRAVGHPRGAIRGAIRVGVRGLVLTAYGTGTLPNLEGSLIPALEEARARDVPVVVVSQCHRGLP